MLQMQRRSSAAVSLSFSCTLSVPTRMLSISKATPPDSMKANLFGTAYEKQTTKPIRID